jgi:hypothetical protein
VDDQGGPDRRGSSVARLLNRITEQPAAPEPSFRLSEALVLGTGTAVAIVAWASLVLATAGVHTLVGVLAVSLVAGAALVVLVIRLPGRPPLRVDALGLLLALGVGLVSAAFAFPGFPYGVVDKDPGVYVVHGQAIARDGSLTYDDEVVERDLPVTEYTPSARFPGIWHDADDPTTIRPQFFHLFPALLATADDLAGTRGLNNVNSALAVLATMAVALAVRRAFGLAAGGAAGILLATNVLQVWQAKYPTTEVLAQLLLGLALLAAALALETRWRPPAFLAGLFLSLTFLARPDGVLLVLGGLGAAAAIVAFAGWDRRIGWFLAGIAVALPHAALQAWRWNRVYSDANDVPTARTFVALVVLLAVGVGLWHFVARRPAEALGQRAVECVGGRRLQVAAGVVLTAGTVVFLWYLWNRETFLGQDLLPYNDVEIRSYDEINLLRLTWFISLPAVVLLCAGVLVLGVRRWRAVQWLVVLPTVALLPVYLWSARISPRLMWWGRRYVPSALVGMLILVAVALAFAWAYRGRWWPVLSAAATLAFVGLVVFYGSQALDVRPHRELGGTAGAVQAIADLSGDQQGVYLWAFADDEVTTPGRDLGAAVWLAHDQISVLLPRRDEAGAVRAVEAYREAYPDQPVFVVTPGDDPPPGELAEVSEPVHRLLQTFPMWDETTLSRPVEAGLYGIDLTVWELDPPGSSGPSDGSGSSTGDT